MLLFSALYIQWLTTKLLDVESFEHEGEAQALSEKIKSLGKDHGGQDESLIGTFDDNVDEASDWLWVGNPFIASYTVIDSISCMFVSPA